jgi:hypothetical protein
MGLNVDSGVLNRELAGVQGDSAYFGEENRNPVLF